jgi:hypothetical protein
VIKRPSVNHPQRMEMMLAEEQMKKNEHLFRKL